jgi:hypothetical protein
MRTLMGHLAQFSSFSKQGELLCTHGLAYLLQNPDACRAFCRLSSERVGSAIGPDLRWRAEVRQQDRGRPDLEGCTADGKAVVKIEAKLGAAFGEDQLSSYLADFQRRHDSGVLLVLVPRHRAAEIIESVSSAFALTGDGPWRLGETPDCSIAVIYWKEVLEALGSVRSERFESDLAQFRAMSCTGP